VAIACAGTEEADIGDTTCTANEHVGITFDGWVGKVRACASFGHLAYTDASGYVNAAFQVVETGNASQTILTEGGERIPSSIDGATTAVGEGVNPVKVCGVFSVNGKTTLRVVYEQTAASNVTVNRINADADANIGQQDIHWSVIPISGTMHAKINPAVAIKYISGDVTVASGSLGIIDFETLDYNSGNGLTITTGASWKATVDTGAAGYYSVCFNGGLYYDTSELGVNEPVYVYLYKSGVSQGVLDKYVSPVNLIGATFTAGVSGCADVSVVEGDYLDVRMGQSSGSTLDVTQGIISIHKIQN
jgi:limonene-1,2-epoxide hydrolase